MDKRVASTLPICRGGCPKRRLSGERPCKSYKDDPERYVLAALERAERVRG